jgi:hypothetical protein
MTLNLFKQYTGVTLKGQGHTVFGQVSQLMVFFTHLDLKLCITSHLYEVFHLTLTFGV